MNKINWFPEYWNFVEKTKLFDFWRSRYCKNQIYFSPNNENAGGVGFFDASYEYLKYAADSNRLEKIKKDFVDRKQSLLKELKNSCETDKRRILLLIEAEEKAYEYWQAKMILKPIEDDVPQILKQSIWLIDEKERVFKEAMSNLIEYDRKNLSPITFPERNLNSNPINLNECNFWLLRENRKFIENSKDKIFLEKNKEKIKELDKFSLIKTEFKPKILIDRHNRAVKKEKGKGFDRTKNGDLIKNKEILNFFERPELIYSNELKEEDISIQIEKFIENDLSKYKLEEYGSEIKIFKNDKNEINLNNVIKQKGNNIPENPYVILHASLFSVLEKGEIIESENVLNELKLHIKERNERIKERLKKEKKQPKKNEIKKNNLMDRLFYFFKKEGKIIEKEIKENDKLNLDLDNNKILKKEGIIFIKEQENYQDLNMIEKNLELIKDSDLDLMPNYEDEFDDKTRFNFFIKDKKGYKFDRKLAIKKFLETKKEISNKFKNISTKLKNKFSLQQLKEVLTIDKKESEEYKLGIETPEERMSNKVDNLEFKRQLEQLKEDFYNKNNKFEPPKYIYK